MSDIHVEVVLEFEGGNEPLWYLAKGHVDKAQFVSEVKHEFERDIPVEHVKHAFMRYVPTGHKGEQTIHIASKKPGAFPVTYIDLWCI